MSGYFSDVRGRRQGYGLSELQAMVRDLYLDLRDKDNLTQWLGYHCIDNGAVPGTGGTDPSREILRDIGRKYELPPDPEKGAWPEEAVFDFLQFLGKKVSSPVPESGRYHEFNDCGWHGQAFTAQPARTEYIERVNQILGRYDGGWAMKPDFEILERAPSGMDDLLEAKLPASASASVARRVDSAIGKYRRRNSTIDDRRDAVRDLGDILEFVRDKAKTHLRGDESDLFNILNNFNIRHHNSKQKSDYEAIWLSGLFYHFLAMIYVLFHVIEREAKEK
jgi:hypothetical protein